MEGHPLETRILKLKPNCCKGCVRKVKQAMLKVEGVHSIKVNANEGTIEMNSDIDPQVLITMAAKVCKRAELLWEPEPPQMAPLPSPPPPTTTTPPPPPSTTRRRPTNTAPPTTTTTRRRPTPPPPITPPTTSPSPPPACPAQSTSQPEVHIRNFDGSNQKVYLHDLVDINAREIKDMKIINKRIIKISLKEPHDNPSSDHSGDSPSPIATPPSDSKNNNGGGEASSSTASSNVEVVTATTAAQSEIKEVPSNRKPMDPAVANVNCSTRGSSCRLM